VTETLGKYADESDIKHMDRDLIEIICYSLFEAPNISNNFAKKKFLINKIISYLIGKQLGYDKNN